MQGWRWRYPGDENIVATGASGFGIMALVVGVERGFITRTQGAERMLKIVEFLGKADRFHGAWPHFLDGRTGKALPVFGKYDGGSDLVETAFLMQIDGPSNTLRAAMKLSAASTPASPNVENS